MTSNDRVPLFTDFHRAVRELLDAASELMLTAELDAISHWTPLQLEAIQIAHREIRSARILLSRAATDPSSS